MVEAAARILVRPAVSWAIIVLTLALGLVSGVLAMDVTQDDDVLAFLPDTNPEIAAFRDISATFGSTDVALIGVAVDDPFQPEVVQAILSLTERLRDLPGLDSAVTMTNLSDFEPDPATGGIVTAPLVRTVPDSPEAVAALRAKVMSRDHVVGTFVSEDADALLLYAFVQPGADTKAIAGSLRALAAEELAGFELYFGGAPFIGTYIFETTQADMARLIPWSVLAILLVMMLAFRDLLGTVLGLLATGVGIAVARAAMAVLDVPFNIVLSSMPVILFAVGSAYAIHLLSHYDHHAREVGETPEAVVRTLVGTGPTVFAAGLTTVAGLLSFVTMDIVPMQTFGLYTALGIFTALVTSLLFVPAVMAQFPRPVRPETASFLQPITQWVACRASNRRVVFGAGAAAVVALALTSAFTVQSRMDLAAFFAADSPPARAQDFMEREFGGSQFLQIRVRADHTDPAVLREIRRVGDILRGQPHVSGVTTIADAMAIVHEAMEGSRRLPDTTGQAKVLYRFLASDPAVSRLITDDQQTSLMQIKLDTADAGVLDEILVQAEALVATVASPAVPFDPTSRGAHWLDARVGALIQHHRLNPPPSATGKPPLAHDVVDVLEVPVDRSAIADGLAAFLGSEESWVVLTPEQVSAVSLAAAQADDTPEGLRAALGQVLLTEDGSVDSDLVTEVLMAVEIPLMAARRTAGSFAKATALASALNVALPEGPRGVAVLRDLSGALQELDAPAGDGATRPLQWTLSGTPVLYRGLSRSVTANQFKSLGTALSLVFVILSVLYRSPLAGLIATAPTAATLALVYGAMGVMGVHLDIGTSMLASIILGAGVDYAVHLLAAWEPRDGDRIGAATAAVQATSHGIWTNAVMVAAGFFVLTLGDAKPLQNVGGLTASAMLVAAVCTFVLVPALAGSRAYRTLGTSHRAR